LKTSLPVADSGRKVFHLIFVSFRFFQVDARFITLSKMA